MAIMFSYGSNLCLDQMRLRCPRAVPLGRLVLPGWRLVFRGVADCVPDPNAQCHGGLWRITPECERALDVYEGVSSGMYRKEWIPIESEPEGEKSMLIYTMNSDGIFPPGETYLSCIREGYRDFHMLKAAYRVLDAAVQESWDDKHPMHIERRRHRRNGRPRLAAAPGQAFASEAETS